MIIWLSILSMFAHSAMVELNQKEHSFQFSQLNQSDYMIVDDGVMGGRSNSNLEIVNEYVMYSGRVSIENNGGFASLRMMWPFAIEVADINKLSRVELTVKGDGKKYQFRLRTNRGFDGAAYSYSFTTVKNKIQTIEIPIEKFVPTFRGRVLSDMPKLKFFEVQQMGLLIADKQVGDFVIDLIALKLQ